MGIGLLKVAAAIIVVSFFLAWSAGIHPIVWVACAIAFASGVNKAVLGSWLP